MDYPPNRFVTSTPTFPKNNRIIIAFSYQDPYHYLNAFPIRQSDNQTITISMSLQFLSRRIRLQREKRGLKQHDIAHALQISPQAVSKWERGENAPDIALLRPLAGLLGVSIDWLMGGDADDPDVMAATVLASGVQTARSKSESLPPKAFADWINARCYQATESVLRHDGIPIKYNGPGILCFFSGAGHAARAVRTALHMRLIETEPLKIGVCSGDVYFGSVGHPDYARPDVIGETVSIALLAMDWAVEHTKTGVVVTASTMEAMDDTVTAGPYTDVHLSGISHAVSLIEVS
jgi:transcriptional regulator with XRE-family HTH domain